jgi:hypothetical protein
MSLDVVYIRRQMGTGVAVPPEDRNEDGVSRPTVTRR